MTHHHLSVHPLPHLTHCYQVRLHKRYQCSIPPLETPSVASTSHQNGYQDTRSLATKPEHAPGSPDHGSGPAPLEFSAQSPPWKAHHPGPALRKLPRHWLPERAPSASNPDVPHAGHWSTLSTAQPRATCPATRGRSCHHAGDSKWAGGRGRGSPSTRQRGDRPAQPEVRGEEAVRRGESEKPRRKEEPAWGRGETARWGLGLTIKGPWEG